MPHPEAQQDPSTSTTQLTTEPSNFGQTEHPGSCFWKTNTSLDMIHDVKETPETPRSATGILDSHPTD